MAVRFLVNEFLRSRLYAPNRVKFAKPHPQPRIISRYMQGGQNKFTGGSVLPVDPQLLSRILSGLKQPSGKAPKRV